MEENNENKQEISTGGDPLSRVKTYQDAIKEALKTQDMSASGMLMAEQKKRDDFQKESETHSISNPKNKILMVLAIVLIVSAISIAAFAIIKANQRTPQETGFVMKSKYFLSEKMVEVSSSQLARNTLARIQQAATEPIENGEVMQLVVTKEVKADPTSALDIRVKTSYTTEDFLSMISARTPEILRGSLDPEFMLGVYKSTKNETFVLLRSNNYEKAFSGMLTWESSLGKDMENIFPKEIARAKIVREEEIIPDTVISTSTATSTETVLNGTSTPQVIQKTLDNSRTWHDRVIKNTDTRALLDESGKVVFFYSIIDNEYIFFGADEATFAEVMRRVRSAKLIR